MGKIIVSQNVTLDGVVQDPTGEEGFKHGGWFAGIGDRDREEWARVLLAEAMDAEALLLGRRSDEYFAPRWLSRDGQWADRLNSMPKYVVSATLEEPRWSNATVLNGDVVTEVAKLKQQLAGDIVVYASRQLVHTLMKHDLADELRLIVYPVILGSGDRIWAETSNGKPMRLTSAHPLGDTLAYLTYDLPEPA